MMKWVFTGLIVCSVIFGMFSGNIEHVSNTALSECSKAVEFILKIAGSLCMWSGLMKIAEQSGLTTKMSKLLSPITRLLFHGLNPESKALRMISMNITANLFGLGNAATPLGIAAMKELAKDRPDTRAHIASNHMIMMVVLNTASIQLLPTTIALLRLEYGAANPMDVLPAILISSFVSLSIGVIFCKILNRMQLGLEREAR